MEERGRGEEVVLTKGYEFEGSARMRGLDFGAWYLAFHRAFAFLPTGAVFPE